jgi:sulfofructose kinase
VASANFLPAVTGQNDPFRVLEFMSREYGMRAPGMTLGRDGALVYWQGKFCYSPGFVVETLDTTGAGDIFHGAFIYGLVQGWEMPRILDFANAMAGLNCTKLGARGGIGRRAEAEQLVAKGSRHRNPAYANGPKPRKPSRTARKQTAGSRRS